MSLAREKYIIYSLTPLEGSGNGPKGMIKASRKNGCRARSDKTIELDGFPKEEKITFFFVFIYLFIFLATFLRVPRSCDRGRGAPVVAVVEGRVSCQKRAKNKQSTTHPTVNAFKVIGNKRKKNNNNKNNLNTISLPLEIDMHTHTLAANGLVVSRKTISVLTHKRIGVTVCVVRYIRYTFWLILLLAPSTKR